MTFWSILTKLLAPRYLGSLGSARSIVVVVMVDSVLLPAVGWRLNVWMGPVGWSIKRGRWRAGGGGLMRWLCLSSHSKESAKLAPPCLGEHCKCAWNLKPERAGGVLAVGNIWKISKDQRFNVLWSLLSVWTAYAGLRKETSFLSAQTICLDTHFLISIRFGGYDLDKM